MQRETTNDPKSPGPTAGPIRRSTKAADNEDVSAWAKIFARYARENRLIIVKSSYLGSQFASSNDGARHLDAVMKEALSEEAKNRMGGFVNARKMLIPAILDHLNRDLDC
jgi:hypothetical protein